MEGQCRGGRYLALFCVVSLCALSVGLVSLLPTNAFAATAKPLVAHTAQNITSGCTDTLTFGQAKITDPSGCSNGHGIIADPSKVGHWTTTDNIVINDVSVPVVSGTTVNFEGSTDGASGKMSLDISNFTPLVAKIPGIGSLIKNKLLTVTFPSAKPGNVEDLTSIASPGNLKLLGFEVGGSISWQLGLASDGDYYSQFVVTVKLPSIFTSTPDPNAVAEKGGLTSNVAIAVKKTGISLSGLKIEVSNAYIGKVGIKNLCVSYVAAGSNAASPCAPPIFNGRQLIKCGNGINAPTAPRWDGTGTIQLPTSTKTQVGLFVSIINGGFGSAGVTVSNLGNYVPLDPYDTIFLDSAGVGVCVNPRPIKVTGAASIRLAPDISGGNASLKPYVINGQLTYSDSLAPNPWKVEATGALVIFGKDVAHGTLTFDGNGVGTFAADVGVSIAKVASFKGSVSGWFATKTALFNLEGKAELSLAGKPVSSADTVASNKGIAACVTLLHVRVGPFSSTVKFGAGYPWGGSVNVMGNSCDTSKYKLENPANVAASQDTFLKILATARKNNPVKVTTPPPPSAKPPATKKVCVQGICRNVATAAQATASAQPASAAQAGVSAPFTVQVPSSFATTLRFVGANTPPDLLLTSPNGRRIIVAAHGAAVVQDQYAYDQDPDNNATSVMIADPQPGNWTVRQIYPTSAPNKIIHEELAVATLPALATGSATSLSNGQVKLKYDWEFAGQQVMLVARSRNNEGTQVLGNAGGTHQACSADAVGYTTAISQCGVLTFTPLAGANDTRAIYAIPISADGVPNTDQEVKIATFVAHAPAVAPPHAIVLQRFNSGTPGAQLKITWLDTVRARQHNIIVDVLGANHAVLQRFTLVHQGVQGANELQFASIPNVPLSDGISVSIQAFENTPPIFSKSVTVTLAPGHTRAVQAG